MRNLSRLLILVFGLVAATSVFFAVQQAKAARSARAVAEALEKERAELRKKLWDAERQRRDENRPRSTTAENAANVPAESDEVVGPPEPGRPDRSGRGGAFGRMFAAFDTPEAQKLISLQQRGALDASYSDLFKRLNLTPAQLEQFKDLLVEKRTAIGDVMAAARSQGLNGRENRDEIRALMEATQSDLDQNIRSVLGETAYSQYQAYEKTAPQRTVATQLEQRLSYSPTPLTSQQSESLVQILASNPPPTGTQKTSGTGGMFGGASRITALGANGAPITDQAVQQASTVLNSSQLQALQQLQKEQQAQAQLSQIMRAQTQQRRTGGQNSGSGSTPSVSSSTPPKG